MMNIKDSNATLYIKTKDDEITKVMPKTLASNVYINSSSTNTVYEEIEEIKSYMGIDDTNYSEIFLTAYETGIAYTE